MTKFFVTLKANEDAVQLQNGNIRINAVPGDVVETDARGFALAMSSGRFKKARPSIDETPADEAPTEEAPAEDTPTEVN